MKNSGKILLQAVLLFILTLAVLCFNACSKNNDSEEHTCEFAEVVHADFLVSEANCTSSAVYYKSCECGKKSSETFTSGAALGHSYTELVDANALQSEATCTSAATYLKTCSRCSALGTETFSVGEPVPHVLTHHDALEPNETEDGNTEYWSCSGCDNYFSDAEGKNVIEDKAEVFLPSLGHVHNYVQKNTAEKYQLSAATCESAAVYYYSCACGELGTETFTDGKPLSHSYVSNAIEKYLVSEATCSALAVYKKSCSLCGAKGTASFTYGEYAPHANVNHHDAKTATCTTTGNYEYYQCADCSKYFTDEACTNAVNYTDLIITGSHNYTNVEDSELLKSAANCKSGAVYYKSCSVCGDASSETFVSGNPIDHSWNNVGVVAPTCQSGGYALEKCSSCNAERKTNETPKLGNHLQNYTVVREPGCGVTGLGVYSCSNCQVTQEVILEAEEHNYVASATAPTCEAAGYTTYTCSNCGDYYTGNSVDAIGHDWEETERNDATCTNAGYVKYVCSNNGCEKTETLNAFGHTPVAATCTSDSYCSTCNEALAEKAQGHSWKVSEIKEPTCTEDGYQLMVCESCGENKTVTDGFLKTGHSKSIEWTETTVPVDGMSCTFQTVQTGVCCDCGDTLTNYGNTETIHSHVFTITTEATCTTAGVKTYTCTGCSDSYTENYEAPEAHNYNESGVCACGKTKTVVGGTSTSVSGDELKNELEFNDASLSIDDATQSQLGGSNVDLSVDKVDQSIVDEMASNLTDEEKALLAGKDVYNFEMSVDGEYITSFDGKITIKIPYELEGGEDPDDIVVWYLAAVLNENGETVHQPTLVQAKYIVIDNQGYAVFETNHFSYYTVTKLTPAQRCDKFGHNWLVTDVIATCLSEGYTLHYCMRCGAKEFSNEIDPLGHDFVLNEYTRVEVSCTTDGFENHYCSRCGVGYDVIEEAFGHDWISIAKTDATCTASGTETFRCDTCGTERNITIPMLPHSYDSVVTEATCTTAGITTHTCSECGHVSTTDRIAPLGHNDIQTVYAATCLERGYTEHYCDRCEQVFDKDNYQDKSSHHWNVEAPDCENDKYCVDCNTFDTSAENGGLAKGHSFNEDGECRNCSNSCKHETLEYSHDQQATCGEDGYKIYICTECRLFVEGEKLERPEHSYTLVREVEATCITPAYAVYKCGNCKQEHIVESGETADHTYVNGVCSYCGRSNSSFYLNLIESIFTTDGFSISVTNFSYSYERLKRSEWIVYGYMTTVDVNELMLNFGEDGDITGAARLTIHLMPDLNEPVYLVNIRVIIENGYAYIDMDSELDDANGSIRASTEAVIDNMFSGFTDADPEELLAVLEEQIIPVLKLLMDANEIDADEVLSGFFDMFFSYEIVGGNYVYSLDFEKIHELNDNLYNLTVAEFIDHYLGEGMFDEIYELTVEIMNLLVKDIPDYAESHGVDKDTLYEAINAVCQLMGAPDGYDIKDVFESEEAAEYTVGMLFMRGEYDEQNIHDGFAELRENSFYSLSGSEDMYESVKEFIDELAGNISFGFTTDKHGNVVDINADINELVVPQGSTSRVSLSVALSVIFGGSIDVDWDGIISEIENEINKAPAFDDKYTEYANMGGSGSGEMEYNGVWYKYQSMYYYHNMYIHHTSKPMSVNVTKHCGEWLEYRITAEREYIQFPYELRYLRNESGELYLLVDRYNNMVELYIDMSTYTVTYVTPDGRTGSFVLEGEGFTREQLILCFGDLSKYQESSYLSVATFYYNPVTGEMTEESRHVYNVTEQVDPTDCGNDGYYLHVCEICGDSYKSSFNYMDHDYVIDHENSDIPDTCGNSGYIAYYCTLCGESYTEHMYVNHNYKEVYLLHEGSQSCQDGIDCAYTCVNCGDVAWVQEYWTYNHIYTNVYEIIDNKIYYTNSCAVCGEGGKGGYYCDIECNDATLDGLYGNGEYLEITFTPGVSGLYELYSYGNYKGDPYAYLLDRYGNRIYDNDDSGAGYNFGMLCALTAGETYTLRVRSCQDATICIKLHDESKDITIDLSAYGCTCDGFVYIRNAYGAMMVDTEHYSKCGLWTSYGERFEEGNSCQRVGYLTVFLRNDNTGEELIIYQSEPYATGEVYHRTHGNYEYDNGETVDENGNYLTYGKEIYTSTCYNCGIVVVKEERTYYYSNGNQVKYEYVRYEYSYATNELYKHSESITEYINVQDSYGNVYNRPVYEYHAEYSAYGEVSSFEKSTYSYDGCRITRITSTSYGKDEVYTYFEHRESVKEIPDESGTIYNDDGSRVVTNTHERYCTICAASLSKWSNEYTYDANDNRVKEVYTAFTSYALSEDVYGYYVSEVTTKEYITFEYLPGKYVTRESYSRTEHYDIDGIVNGWNSSTYNYYSPCEYDVTYNSYHGENWTNYNCTSHSTYSEYRLREGSVTCNDGLDCWYVCRYCDHEYLEGEYWSYSHYINSNDEQQGQHFDLSEYGSQCGGMLSVYHCACEREYSINLNCGCEFDYDHYYKYDYSDTIMEYHLYTYGCAVTHTVDGYSPCGFVYTSENWVEISEGCLGVRHIRYTFGLNSANPLVIEWTYSIGNYYHDTDSHTLDGDYYVEDGLEVYVTGHDWICRRCGLTTERYVKTSYVEPTTGLRLKEITTSTIYNNNGGIERISYYESELSRDPVLGRTAFNTVYSLDTYYNRDGSIGSITEYVYEYEWVYDRQLTGARYVCTYENRSVYYSLEDLENGNSDYWYTYQHDYSECICRVHTIFTSSYGEYNDYYSSEYHYSYYDTYWYQEPTCTQDGVRAQDCRWCDYISTWTYGAYGHSYQWSSETQTYHCTRCELENFTGYDGTIRLEDLTWKYGNGQYYVIGYKNTRVSCDIYVSLIINARTEEEDEILLNDFMNMTDDGSLLYISIADLNAAIAAVGNMMGENYSICSEECMVRISFVPDYNDYDLDYAITLDPHSISYSTDAAESGELPITHTAVCTDCGVTVKSGEYCNFVRTYYAIRNENGIVYEDYAYTCRQCGNYYEMTVWTEKTNSANCTYTRYERIVWAGGDVLNVQDTYISHNYVYAFNESSLNDSNSFNPNHSRICTDCGDSYSYNSGCYTSSTTSEFIYIENGVKKTTVYMRCDGCGFVFKRVHYTVLTNPSTCEHTEYYVFYWDWNGRSYAGSVTTSNTFTSHDFTSYVSIDTENANEIGRHNCYCDRCGIVESSSCYYYSREESMLVDGIMHNYVYYTCYLCGFEYRVDYYNVSNECLFVEYNVYTWTTSDGQQHSYTYTYDSSSHAYISNYVDMGDGQVMRTTLCSGCGFVGSESTMCMNSPYEVELVTDNNSQYLIYKVTVSASSTYKFYSANNSRDTYGYIYDEYGNMVNSDDDSGGAGNFYMETYLEAGQTYYLRAIFYSERNSNEQISGYYDLYFDHVSI